MSSVLHAVAPHAVQRGAICLVDEVVVQGQEFGLLLAHRLGLAGADPAQDLPCEEQLARGDAAFVPLQVARVAKAAHQGKDAGGGAQAQHPAELGHGREGLVALPVRAQGRQVPVVGHRMPCRMFVHEGYCTHIQYQWQIKPQ
jgi:hypothetical protein